jgi:mutator protein MutT
MERVRAIIIENGKLLTFRRKKNNEIYWVFPGGGVEIGENHESAIKRECKEELGVEIEKGEIIAQYEFGNDLEYFYKCRIISGMLGTGNGPEFQPGYEAKDARIIEWLSVIELKNFDLRPKAVTELISNENYGKGKEDIK